MEKNRVLKTFYAKQFLGGMCKKEVKKMGNDLTLIIKDNVERLFYNFDTAMKTCNMEYMLFDVPVWKHVYHTLHSMDQWFINPDEFEEPPFHIEGLNNIDVKSKRVLTDGQLYDYFNMIRKKTTDYMETLDDDMLLEKPAGSGHTRLGLILGQIRHTYSHMGNINATTMMEKKRWPRVAGISAVMNGKRYE